MEYTQDRKQLYSKWEKNCINELDFTKKKKITPDNLSTQGLQIHLRNNFDSPWAPNLAKKTYLKSKISAQNKILTKISFFPILIVKSISRKHI